MHKFAKGVAFATALALCSGSAYATDNLIPGKIAIVKPAKLAKLVSKPAVSFPLPTGPDNPTTTGGVMNMFDTIFGAGVNVYSLPQIGWTALGNPPGSKGFKYKGAGSLTDPCKVVLVKAAVIKAVCKGTAVTLNPPFNGQLGIVLTMGVGQNYRYCASLGGTTIKNQAGLLKRKDAPPPGACPTPGPAPTTSTTTTTTSTTTTTAPPACCGAERITLTSSAGTLQVDNLPPFPFPTGVLTVMDTTAATIGLPTCQHNVHVPAFAVPNFDIPALNYCSQVVPTGCEAGSGVGKGTLWDGNGSTAANVHVTKNADTSDGTCDATYNGSNCTNAGVGSNTLGQIVTSRTPQTGSGVRSAIDIPVHSLTWSDSVCSPAITPGCCPGSNYNPSDGDLLITEFDFILSPTTGSATGAFVDLNLDTCKRAGAGFDNPGPDGPKTLTGSAATGPCCTVGQATTVVSVGVGFSGGAPLFDLGFKSTIPNTVSACGVPSNGSCVITTNTCLGSPSGAFLE